MLVLLLIIQKDRFLLTNNFVNEIRNRNGVKLIEVDNYSETDLIDSVQKVIENSEEEISVTFYSEGDYSPGQIPRVVNVLIKQKQRLKQVAFEGGNLYFKNFKAVLEL